MTELEKHLCPRRKEHIHLPEFVPENDTWETNRWTVHQDDQWPEVLGTLPRSCSFCGSIHPEDAIRMIRDEGWEINPSTKFYKWYIEPPGTMLHHRRLIDVMGKKEPGCGDDSEVMAAMSAPKHIVTPCVKFYGMHGDEDQLKTLNGLLDRQRSAGALEQ